MENFLSVVLRYGGGVSDFYGVHLAALFEGVDQDLQNLWIARMRELLSESRMKGITRIARIYVNV